MVSVLKKTLQRMFKGKEGEMEVLKAISSFLREESLKKTKFSYFKQSSNSGYYRD